MKKFIALSLSLVTFLYTPLSCHADSFIKTEFVSNGSTELKEKFVVKKGEYVNIKITNKARGGITLQIEDSEGNIVVKNALTVDSGIEEARQKEVDIDLPAGLYILKAQGKTYRISNAFVNRDEVESSNGYFKIKLKTIKYKR